MQKPRISCFSFSYFFSFLKYLQSREPEYVFTYLMTITCFSGSPTTVHIQFFSTLSLAYSVNQEYETRKRISVKTLKKEWIHSVSNISGTFMVPRFFTKTSTCPILFPVLLPLRKLCAFAFCQLLSTYCSTLIF